MYITHRPLKGLGYDIHGRTDRRVDIRKGRDKEAIFFGGGGFRDDWFMF